MGILYNGGTNMARAFFTLFAKWEVEGREAVPPRGPLIVVSNHLSHADPPILVSSLPRPLHFMGKPGLFTNPIARAFLTRVGVHPMNQEGTANIETLKWNLELLKQNKVVALFPEGTRSREPGMSKGKSGIAYLAIRSQAPILPVGITGTENITNGFQLFFPLCHLKVKIGEPFSLPVLEGRLSQPILENMTDMIMQRVAALLPPEYRGVYHVQGVGAGEQPSR
jgi:1-acyl-sn-glycerol-3-phosphate acyltransferase